MKNIKTYNQFINECSDNNLITEGFVFDSIGNNSIGRWLYDSLLDDIHKQFYGKTAIDKMNLFYINENGELSVYYEKSVIIKDILKETYPNIVKKIKEFFKSNVKVATDDYIQKKYNNLKGESDVYDKIYDPKTGFSLVKTLAVKSGVKLNELGMPPFEDFGYALIDVKMGAVNGVICEYDDMPNSFDNLVHSVKMFYNIK